MADFDLIDIQEKTSFYVFILADVYSASLLDFTANKITDFWYFVENIGDVGFQI